MSKQGQRLSRQDQQKLVKKIKNYIYDPAQVIGSGFSSNVYKGLNQLNGQTIAIKVLQLSKIVTEVEKYLLNNQINALRALSHTHVLRTVQILMTKNNVYIMTEYCENGDLQQYIKRQGKLLQLQALHIIRDVTEGYLAVEEKKIVHRDLKTANIFLTTTGARIADFGFCQFLNQSKKPQVFYNVGSPAYMSPESYRDNIYSPKSDLWSIGVIFYEMLVGQTPDKNLTYSQMSTNLMSGRITSVNNDQIKKILSGCFKKDLKERLTPSQLLDAINNQINRLQAPKYLPRPQTVQPGMSSTKLATTVSVLPISPSQQTLQRNSHSNRHMIASMVPPERQTEVRSQSPFKPRFVNQLVKEEKRDASPMRGQIEKRFREQSPFRGGPVREPQVKVKSLTEMLLFLYRLLNYLGQTNLQVANFMRLILFRHRSYLQSSVDKYMNDEHLDRSSHQPYKEFQFLKSRFDQTYLQKQSQAISHPLPTNIIGKLNELSNQPFNSIQAIIAYCGLIIEGCKQCQRMVGEGLDAGDLSKTGILWDYLMIHFEILQLYAEGLAIERITQQAIALPIILKDQPKKIGNAHCELMKIKLRNILQYFQYWSAQTSGERRTSQESNNGRISDIPERKVLINNGFF